MSIISLDEALPVEEVHDIYPTIDPTTAFKNQTFKGKTVLITGASRGIGQETAIQFARAGANIVIVARIQETLDVTKNMILKQLPNAQVLTFTADITNTERAAEAVKFTVEKFGGLDVLVANAGALRPIETTFAQLDPNAWWKIVEVNLRGTYNYIHFAIPELKKTKGVVIAVSTIIANFRLPFTSDYAISKHALNRLIEFVPLENPEIKAFAVHPGFIESQMARESRSGLGARDTIALPVATFIYLASGKADYLSGRYISAGWDLGEVEAKYKDKILEQHGLVQKLSIPV